MVVVDAVAVGAVVVVEVVVVVEAEDLDVFALEKSPLDGIWSSNLLKDGTLLPVSFRPSVERLPLVIGPLNTNLLPGVLSLDVEVGAVGAVGFDVMFSDALEIGDLLPRLRGFGLNDGV